MKIQVLSDLHREFTRDIDCELSISATDADVVILAGDVDVGMEGVHWAIRESERLAKPIIMVPGNHEYWDSDFYEMRSTLLSACKGTNVHLLDRRGCIIDGVRFLGATLWTDYGKGNQDLIFTALHRMNDYRRIKAIKWWMSEKNQKRIQRLLDTVSDHNEQFVPLTALDEHRYSLRWLKNQLKEPFDGQTVVVSHHAPSRTSLLPSISEQSDLEPKNWKNGSRYSDNSDIYKIAAYASDLDDLLCSYSDNIDLWVHGHTHWTLDYATNGVRIVCNPRGYPGRGITKAQFLLAGLSVHEDWTDPAPLDGDVPTFDPEFVVDLEDGLLPAMLPIAKEKIEKWDPLISELERYKHLATTEDSDINSLLLYRLIEVATQFNAVTTNVVQYLKDNVWANDDRRNEEVDNGLWNAIGDWFGSVEPIIEIGTIKWHFEYKDIEAKDLFEKSIKQMYEIRSTIADNIEEIIRGKRTQRNNDLDDENILDW